MQKNVFCHDNNEDTHTKGAYRNECAECLFSRSPDYLGSLIYSRSNESEICFDKQGDVMDYEKICFLLIFTWRWGENIYIYLGFLHVKMMGGKKILFFCATRWIKLYLKLYLRECSQMMQGYEEVLISKQNIFITFCENFCLECLILLSLIQFCLLKYM